MNKIRILFFITIFLITYGSLYPFDFKYNDFYYDDFIELFFENDGVFRLSDLIANIVLFIPYGIVSFLLSTKSYSTKLKLLFYIIFGISFSVFLQIIQVYFPSRVVAFSDVLWNVFGIFIGIFISFIFRSKIYNIESKVGILYCSQVFLITFWIASNLIPFVPTLQVDLVRDNVKYLIESSIYINEVIFQTVAWIVCLYFIFSIRKKISIFYLLVSFTLVAKLFVVDSQLTISMVGSSILSILLGSIFIRYVKINYQKELLSLLIILSLLINSLSPLYFNYELNEFSWIPFSGFLEGSMLLNAQSLCEKTFMYGSLVWLLALNSSKIKIASIFVSFLLFFIEILQIFIGNHTPEITDPIFVFLIAYMLHFIETTKYQTENENSNTVDSSMALPEEERIEKPVAIREFTFKSILIPYIIVLCISCVIFKIILSHPNIPYNVKEMFLGGGSLFSIFVFLNVLLWIGASAVICSHLIQRSKFQLLALPGYVMISGLISLALLYLSVTEETIADIVGSTNLNWFVIEKKIWGELGAKIFITMDAPGVVSFFERIVRYLALYSPIIFLLVIFNMVINRAKKNLSKAPLDLLSFTLISLPWLYLCKIIAFTHSSTDNLNELIARPGEYDLGGGGYVYLLLILVVINSVLISRINTQSIVRLTSTLAITLLFVPVGWYLINAGLVTDFRKYDGVYSGVDFLLGPDRTTLLSNKELFFRWSIVQMAIVFTLGYGQGLMLGVLQKMSDKTAKHCSDTAIYRSV